MASGVKIPPDVAQAVKNMFFWTQDTGFLDSLVAASCVLSPPPGTQLDWKREAGWRYRGKHGGGREQISVISPLRWAARTTQNRKGDRESGQQFVPRAEKT